MYIFLHDPINLLYCIYLYETKNYVIWQKGKAKLHKGSIANVFFSYVGLELKCLLEKQKQLNMKNNGI